MSLNATKLLDGDEIMIDTSFDALVLVHPDFLSMGTKYEKYKYNLTPFIQDYTTLEKPVFIVQDKDCNDKYYMESREMGNICSSAIRVPVIFEGGENDLPDFTNRDQKKVPIYAQRSVDFVSKTIGEIPEKLKIAFGGIYGKYCVQCYADAWSKDILIVSQNGKSRVPYMRKNDHCERPIKTASILEVVSIFS